MNILKLFVHWPPLKELGYRQVEKMARHFSQQKLSFLDYAETRWWSQFEEHLWTLVEQTAHRLRKKATISHQLETERLVEQGDDGRVVLISVAPARGENYLIRSFPKGNYCEFYRNEHSRFHEIPNWAGRDFVHWIFLWDEEASDVHLLYEFSLKMRLALIDYQITRAKKRGQTEPFHLTMPPRIIPESSVCPIDLKVAADEIWDEELKLFFRAG